MLEDLKQPSQCGLCAGQDGRDPAVSFCWPRKGKLERGQPTGVHRSNLLLAAFASARPRAPRLRTIASPGRWWRHQRTSADKTAALYLTEAWRLCARKGTTFPRQPAAPWVRRKHVHRHFWDQSRQHMDPIPCRPTASIRAARRRSSCAVMACRRDPIPRSAPELAAVVGRGILPHAQLHHARLPAGRGAGPRHQPGGSPAPGRKRHERHLVGHRDARPGGRGVRVGLRPVECP